MDRFLNQLVSSSLSVDFLKQPYSPYSKLFVFVALLEYAAVNFISRQEAGLLELLQKKRIARKKRQRQVKF